MRVGARACDFIQTHDLLANREVGWVVVDAISLVGRSIQDVVDALGIGLDEAGEAAEQLADDRAGLDGRVLEEHVIGIGDLDEEVRAAAWLALLVGPWGSAGRARRWRRSRCRTRSINSPRGRGELRTSGRRDACSTASMARQPASGRARPS
jgi:hypothetical protein